MARSNDIVNFCAVIQTKQDLTSEVLVQFASFALWVRFEFVFMLVHSVNFKNIGFVHAYLN